MSCEGAEFTAEGNTLHNVQKPIGFYNSDETDITDTDNIITSDIFEAAVNGYGYTTLEAALAAAEADDVVEVIKAGEYTDNITIDKAITFKGTEGAVFSGVIDVTADGAVLDGINVHYEGIRGRKRY